MGNLSLNKLGGLSIIVGPVLALVFYLLQPGGLLIDSADPSDAQATIAALVSNSAMSHLSAFLIPLGLLLFLHGFLTVQNKKQNLFLWCCVRNFRQFLLRVLLFLYLGSINHRHLVDYQ